MGTGGDGGDTLFMNFDLTPIIKQFNALRWGYSRFRL